MNEAITKHAGAVQELAERIMASDRSTLTPMVAAKTLVELEAIRAQLSRLADTMPTTASKADGVSPLFG